MTTKWKTQRAWFCGRRQIAPEFDTCTCAARKRGASVVQRTMRPLRIIVLAPFFNHDLGFLERLKPFALQAFFARFVVKRLNETILPWLHGLSGEPRTHPVVGTQKFGPPRGRKTLPNNPMTSSAWMEWATRMATHSRVNSSNTLKVLNGRPPAKRSCKISYVQICLGWFAWQGRFGPVLGCRLGRIE